MFGFLTILGNERADPLAGVEAANAFCRALPQNDVLAAQEALCAALAEPNVRDASDMDRLRALLALDKEARALCDALLDGYISSDPQMPAMGQKAGQAAFELCRVLGKAHSQFLKAIPDGSKLEGSNEHVSLVALYYFQYRQTELLLRPYVDEKSTRFPWKEVHDAFKFAQARDLAEVILPVNRRGSPNATDTTLEREYLHVLLQDLVNGGHLPPTDALWVMAVMPRWSRAVKLKSRADPTSRDPVAVDMDGDSGIGAAHAKPAGTGRRTLDLSPLVKAMRDELASLGAGPERRLDGSTPGTAQRRRILAKLHVLCATERPLIARRGERTPTALTVEVVVGMTQILGKLRNEAQQAVVAAVRAVAGEGVTVTGFGSLSESTVGPLSIPGAATNGRDALDGGHPSLTMVDRSDSGCRLHGPTLASNPIVPGVLIAFRDGPASPFMLGVVRWVKKRLAGKRVELGVEYLGRDPRRVVVVIPPSGAAADASSGSEPPRFAALYLSGNAKNPSLPMKTLVLPVRGLAPGDRLSVRSRKDTYTIQLKEALEEQAEFVWSPFAILEHRKNGDAS